jgi:hypothetical protein
MCRSKKNGVDKMNTMSLRRLAINEDVDAEFGYWKSQLLFSAWTATGSAVAVCAAIAFWPPGSGNPELRSFALQFWTLLAECAFWFGFLLGLLWGAARRLGAALAGSLPWQPLQRRDRRAVFSRFCGQGGVGFAMAGAFIWLAWRLAPLADAEIAWSDPTPLTQVCLGVAAVLGVAAAITRNRG